MRANTLARCRSWKLGLGGRGPGILGALNKVALQPGSTPQRRAETRTPRLAWKLPRKLLRNFPRKNGGISRDFYIVRDRRLNSTVSDRPTWDHEAWFVWNSTSFLTQPALPSSLATIGAIKSKTRRLRSIQEKDEWMVFLVQFCPISTWKVRLTMVRVNRKLE